MKEEQMDRQIRDAARESYNDPPAPPRDEMWAAIRAARQAERDARQNGGGPSSPDVMPLLPGSGESDVVPLRRRVSPWVWRVLPIAALLLLSFGLGRLSFMYQRGSSLATNARATTTSPAASTTAAAPTTSSSARPAEPTTPPAAGSAALAAASQGASDTPRENDASPAPRTYGSIYRLAASQTLGQAELLLTSFRAESKARGSVDPQVAEWAGDILSSTRLLLDSPAGRDPKLRGLLEDLELVLAQIVQFRDVPANARPGDADLIDHALQQRDLLPRLRTAVPAGAPVGT